MCVGKCDCGLGKDPGSLPGQESCLGGDLASFPGPRLVRETGNEASGGLLWYVKKYPVLFQETSTISKALAE